MSSPLETLESQIRNGKIVEAHHELLELVETDYPRENARTIAALLRRVNDPESALRVLNPIIRPTRKAVLKATDEEKVEYAASLVRVGSLFESKWLLSHLNLKEVPEGNLVMAFSLFPEWKYAEAIPYLRSYLANPKIQHYDRLVGLVNLTAALIREKQFNEAESHIKNLIQQTKEEHPRLYANTLELCAQLCIFSGRYDEAEKDLITADDLLKKSPILDTLFIEKWLAILDVVKTGNNPSALDALYSLKVKSQQMNHWETIRECDKYLCIATKDKELFQKVYFGTPYDDYKKRLLADFPEKIELPRNYIWDVNSGVKPSREFSIFDGSLDRNPTDMKVGQATHRLLQIFCSDFYRPFRIGTLFGGLHPGEYFNPITSPAKVHQAVFRIRQWLLENQIPLAIKQEGLFYSLEGSGEVGMAVSQYESRRHPQLRVLYGQFQEKPFSAKEAALILQTPLRSLQRFLTSMTMEGHIEKTGSSTNVRYTIRRKNRAANQNAA